MSPADLSEEAQPHQGRGGGGQKPHWPTTRGWWREQGSTECLRHRHFQPSVQLCVFFMFCIPPCTVGYALL